MFNKNILLVGASSLGLGGLCYAYNKLIPQEENITIAESSKPKEMGEERMIRKKIFGDGEYIDNEFDHSLISRDKWNNSEVTKQKIEDSLSRLVKRKLKVRNNIVGRIYYEIKALSLEVYVVWKNSPNQSEFTHYDRFEILLTN